MGLSFALDDGQKSFLGRQAIRSITTRLDGETAAGPARPDDVAAAGVLERPLGSFVTLTRNGELRGCIGTIIGREPLYLNVWNMARAAAFDDPRFPAVCASEWASLNVEITVLDQPSRCPDPRRIVIGRDGLILAWHGRTGVFLPQVPVEQGWDLDAYLAHLCIKAGVPVGTWADPDADLYWYQALAFSASRDGGG